MRTVVHAAAMLASLGIAAGAHATNSYVAVGYGARSVAVGGTAIALPQDTLAAAANPAGMAFVEAGLDAGARLLTAPLQSQIDCTGIGGCTAPVEDLTDRQFFLIPNLGFVRHHGPRLSLGVTLYANGGINTSFGRDLYGEALARIAGVPPGAPGSRGTGKLGVDFSQIVLSPTVAWRATDSLTVGLAPLLAFQKLSARGLATFAPLSSDPGSLTNRGASWSYGVGVRVGLIWKPLRRLTLGAAYSPRIRMSHFQKYEGLLADRGRVDVPENFGFGVAVELTDRLTWAADVVRLAFGDVEAFANPGVTAAELAGTINPARRLGGPQGIGFGWNSVWVWKTGVVYRATDRLTLRAGYDQGQVQIPAREALMAALAPAVPKRQATAGFSWRLGQRSELGFAVLHAFRNSIFNPSTALAGAPVRSTIQETTVDLSYSRRF